MQLKFFKFWSYIWLKIRLAVHYLGVIWHCSEIHKICLLAYLFVLDCDADLWVLRNSLSAERLDNWGAHLTNKPYYTTVVFIVCITFVWLFGSFIQPIYSKTLIHSEIKQMPVCFVIGRLHPFEDTSYTSPSKPSMLESSSALNARMSPGLSNPATGPWRTNILLSLAPAFPSRLA